MANSRRILAALLVALIAGGCGDAETAPPAATGATTTTLPSKAVLKAALLTTVDVPGSLPLEDSGDAGFSTAPDPASCAGLESAGATADPNDVEGPDLQVLDGGAFRFYTSMAGLGTVEQVSGLVTQLTSAAGIACGVGIMKAAMSQDVDGVRIDGSGLTGSGSTVPVGDGGGIISIRGNLRVERQRVPMGADLIVFRKGNAVAMVTVFAARGTVADGQAVELANRIAARLP